jgi:hypothetical protein
MISAQFRRGETMKSFCVADLNVRGELLAEQEYRYDQLAQIPGADELITTFAARLWQSEDEFELTLATSAGVQVRWRASSDTSGVFSLRCQDNLASLSLLACGVNLEADRLTFQAFQQHLLRELHGTATEPAFALMDLQARPLVATINFLSPPNELDRLIVALSDRCFAAAYFRTKGLA